MVTTPECKQLHVGLRIARNGKVLFVHMHKILAKRIIFIHMIIATGKLSFFARANEEKSTENQKRFYILRLVAESVMAAKVNRMVEPVDYFQVQLAGG